MTEINNVLGVLPNLDVNSRKHKTNIILQGGADGSYLKTTSQNVSSSNCSFNVTISSDTAYLPRVVYLQLQGTTTLNGASAGAGTPYLQCPGLPHAAGVPVGAYAGFAPRCDPLNQIISQMVVNINGFTVTGSLNQYSRILQSFHRSIDEENKELGMSPMMPDNSLNYSDVAMSVRSPLNTYLNNCIQDPRGSYPNVCVTANTALGAADSATINWSFITPLILSPFVYTKNFQEQLAFNNLNQLTIQLTFGGRGSGALGGLAGGLFSFDTGSGSTVTSATTNITGAFLYNQFINKPYWQSIPPQINYAYSLPTFLPNTLQAPLAPGQSQQYLSVAINRTVTPSQIFHWVSERDSDVDITKTDAYNFAISAVTLQWDTGAPKLSTLSQYDLYQSLHVAKGGNLSWNQWSGRLAGAGFGTPPVYDATPGQSGGTYGSIMCIVPGADFSLEPGDAPGCGSQKHTILFQTTITNISNRPIVPQINTLIIDEGVFVIMPDRAYTNTAVITTDDVKSVDTTRPMTYSPPASVLGGNFLSDLGSFFKRLVRPAITAAQTLVPAQYQPIVSGVSDVARSYGLGREIPQASTAVVPYGLGLGTRKGQGLLMS